MTSILRIKDWSRYMHADCKRSASALPWVKTPTSHTGLGYLELMDHPNGMAHFGAWVLILQVAAKCPTRGTLVTDSGRCIGARELSLKTRGSVDLFAEAIERLVQIGWLEWAEIESHASNLQATCKQPARLEGEGEGEGEERESVPQAASPTPPSLFKVMQKELRKAVMPSDDQATQEWIDMLEGCGCQSGDIAENVHAFNWIVKTARKNGIRVMYAKHVPDQAEVVRAKKSQKVGAA
jgi:hypothetical protein